MNRIFKISLALLLITTCNLYTIAQEKLKGDGQIPVLAWVGVPEEETTIERYKELKASGININFVNYSSVQAVEKALDIAYQVGVKLMPYCPELQSEPEKTVKRLMKHPALFGYHLRDEPHAKDFPELGAWMKRIQAVDKEHPCYINLFPNYGKPERFFDKGYILPPEKDIYEEYVNAFLKAVPVPFVSFDHYPVIENNDIRTLRPEWYKNLEIIAATSKRNGLPFWAFARSVAYGRAPIATDSEIRLQIYSNLAYGASGLQYFTYWTPGINPFWDFNKAPIDLNGKRTELYDRIKEVNQEIQHLAGAFLGAHLVWVAHTGKTIPKGTRRIARLPDPVKILETSDSGAVVSLMEKGNRQFFLLVNRDFQNPMKLTIETDESVKRILKDGTMIQANVYAHSVEVDAGDIILFTWEK